MLCAAGCLGWAKAEEAPDKPKDTAPAAPANEPAATAAQPADTAGEPAAAETEPAAKPSEPGAAETEPAAKESEKEAVAPAAKETPTKVQGILLAPRGEAPKAQAATSKSKKSAAKAKDMAITVKDTAFAAGGIPASDLEGEDDDHKIAPTETIKIDVYGEKDLTVQDLRVQAGGQVKYFLLGDVQVGGLTAREAANLIREQLMDKEYLQNPQVIVTVIQYRKRYVYVLGDVNKPGAIPLEGESRYTIPDVIGQAGGLTRAAKKSKIQFIRQGKIETLDLDKLNKTTDRKLQVFVEPNDTIYIPQSVW